MFLVILAVSPLVLFDIGYQYKEYEDDVARTIAETLSVSRSMSLQVEKELQSRIAILGALATAGNLQLGNLDLFRTRAEAIYCRSISRRGYRTADLRWGRNRQHEPTEGGSAANSR